MCEPRVEISLLRLQDNESCIKTLTSDASSWRSRHHALRAAWIRDMIVTEGVEVLYERGKST
eukprot:11242407-Prorocentrum_lima.AAC.1